MFVFITVQFLQWKAHSELSWDSLDELYIVNDHDRVYEQERAVTVNLNSAIRTLTAT